MNLPSSLSPEKQAFLSALVSDLAAIPGLAAVVLGGSYASGTQHSQSDLDIGLYYHAASPFLIDDIRRLAQKISRPGVTPSVTDFYGWGAWVNGGAWIQTPVSKVDWIYRNLDQLQNTIRQAQEGICLHDYEQQPTYGYYSTGYLAETQICLPLYDPTGLLAALKEQVETYPPLLKQNIVCNSLWSAEFTLIHARNFAAAGDVYNTTGCMSRVSACLTQALFALNECYFLSDKRVLETLANFSRLPAAYTANLCALLAHPGQSSAELRQSITRLEALWQSVVKISDVPYQPKFVL